MYLINLLQKKEMEEEERYHSLNYKRQKIEQVEIVSRSDHMNLKRREENERDQHRFHQEREQYINQYYRTINCPRKF